MSAPASPNPLEAEPNLEVGDKVGVGKNQETGFVRFIGVTQFAQGEWVGVELELPNGKNDGSVKGVQYFTCPEACGIFVRRANLTKVGAEETNVPLSPDTNGYTSDPSGEASVDGRKAKRSISRKSTSRKRSERLGSKNFGSPLTDAVEASDESTMSTPATPSATKGAERTWNKVPSSESLSIQKQLAEAVEERNVEMIRRSLATARTIGGVHQKELDVARGILTFEDNRSVLQEFQGVAQAVETLNMTIKRAEERAAAIQKRAEESQRNLAANVAGTALKEWLSQVVGIVENRVWSTLEERVETKVRNAVRSATKELNDAATRLQGERQSSASSTSKRRSRAKVRSEPQVATKPTPVQAWARLAQLINAMDRRNGIEEQRKELGPRKPRKPPPELPPPMAYGMLDVPGRGLCEVGWQWTGCSWKWCAKSRWSEQEQMSCRSIQRALRRALARKKEASQELRGLGDAVSVVCRRHKAWVSIFQEAAKGLHFLKLSAFRKALREIHPQLSTGQMRALFDGYLEGTAASGIPLKAFCDIAEACAAGEMDAAEFADIHVAAWQKLGFEDDTDPRETAAVKIQQAVRRLRARARIDKKAGMGTVVVVTVRRHNMWVQIFTAVSRGVGVLDLNLFRVALLQVQPDLSRAQIRALFTCYVENTGKTSMDLRGFCDVAEACASGGAVVAEFADMPVREWEYLATQAVACGDDEAAEFADLCVEAPRAPMDRQSIIAKGLSEAADLTSASHQGVGAGLRAAAVAVGTQAAADFADVSLEDFEVLGVEGGEAAAIRIQAVERGRRERAVLRAKASDCRSASLPFSMTFAEPPPGEQLASSYDAAPGANYAFLSPGDEHLFVGGGALNGATGKLLLRKAKQPIAFELDAEGEYVTALDPGVGRQVPVFKQDECLYAKLHKSLFSKARADLNNLVTATEEDIGSAPVEFAAARVYSESDHPFGAAFLGIFKSDMRPFDCPENVALLYTVGPLGRNKKAEGEGEVSAEREKLVKSDKEDFLLEVHLTAKNVMQLVIDYNISHGAPAIKIVRLPIVSGGTFMHPEVTVVDVALSIIWGVHSALAASAEQGACPAVELMPGKDMQEAYRLYFEEGKMPSDEAPYRKIAAL